MGEGYSLLKKEPYEPCHKNHCICRGDYAWNSGHEPWFFETLQGKLSLTGVGIGQLLFFIPTWLASTRINRPLTWWRKVLPEKIRRVLAVFVFRRNLGAELGLLSNFGIVSGVPKTPLTRAIDWFNLFQANRLIGLTLPNLIVLAPDSYLRPFSGGLVFLDCIKIIQAGKIMR